MAEETTSAAPSNPSETREVELAAKPTRILVNDSRTPTAALTRARRFPTDSALVTRTSIRFEDSAGKGGESVSERTAPGNPETPLKCWETNKKAVTIGVVRRHS